MKNIAFAQSSPDMGENRFFDGDAAHDRWLEPFGDFRRELESAGHRCQTLDMYAPHEVDVLITTRYDLRINAIQRIIRVRPDCRIILWAIEEPVVCGLHEAEILTQLDCDRILTWRDDLADGKKLIWSAIPQPRYLPGRTRAVPFAQRRLITAIYSNKSFRHPKELYSKRREVLKTLVQSGIPVDLYGGGWDNADTVLRSVWRGTIKDKYEVQRGYRFTLCFENSWDYAGDITEKPFDSLAAGSIPVYLGAPNIADYVPKACFVDFRDFSSVEALAHYLTHMPEAEFDARLQAIEQYMETDFARHYSGETQARILLRELGKMEKEAPPNRLALPYLIGAIWHCLTGMLRPPWHRKLASLYLILKASLLGDRAWRA